MSSALSSRIKHPKKHELVKSHSQAQILANKLRQDGVMSTGVFGYVHSVKNIFIEMRLPVLPEVDINSLISNGMCLFLLHFWILHPILRRAQILDE
ncbi:hypothetical protein NQ315_010837 [Exocentrus adspersus]|uniref:Uncharacterized protein n=1 Tax=Exocentrus adspersus TaxID=1586481 RepID=A0AAV8V7T6_9CUCU|nr:hypothetical protein NQ315_010837 [Exocentrus adspersus]